MSMKVIRSSICSIHQDTYFLAQDEDTGERFLGVPGEQRASGPGAAFTEQRHAGSNERFYALNAHNAAVLRQRLDWLNPAPLGIAPSFGFGDRLGLATPGHIRSLKEAAFAPGHSMAPIFAQQSVRENARTGRTPQQVLDDAMWAVFQEGWRQPWGADADHLKQVSDLPVFVDAGYSFFTVDPGEHVDAAADTDNLETLREKVVNTLPWERLQSSPSQQHEAYLSHPFALNGLNLAFNELTLLRAAAKYGKAIAHILTLYQALLALKPGRGAFDFEVSVDETETPTSVLEHFYIASELTHLGVRLTSLAPRLPGRFEKGVDYIGDLAQLEAELAQHVVVMRHFAGYKLSLHSGSDKLSVYPLLARLARTVAGDKMLVHVKTAGTSYLEALRVTARLDPPLFRELLTLARQRYSQDRLSYHVSADEQRIPAAETLLDAALPALLDDFDVREALHVTFGSALAQFGDAIRGVLLAHPEAYAEGLSRHFRRHLELFES